MCGPLAGAIAALVPFGVIVSEGMQALLRVPGPEYLRDVLPLLPPTPVYVAPVQYSTVQVTQIVVHTVTDVTTIYKDPATSSETSAPSADISQVTLRPSITFTPTRTKDLVPDLDSELVETRYNQLKQAVAEISLRVSEFVIVVMALMGLFYRLYYRDLRQLSFINLIATIYAKTDRIDKEGITFRWLASIMVRWNLSGYKTRLPDSKADILNPNTQAETSETEADSSREAEDAQPPVDVGTPTNDVATPTSDAATPTSDAATPTSAAAPHTPNAISQTQSVPQTLAECQAMLERLELHKHELTEKSDTLEAALVTAGQEIQELKQELQRAALGAGSMQVPPNPHAWEAVTKMAEENEELSAEVLSLYTAAGELQLDNDRLLEESQKTINTLDKRLTNSHNNTTLANLEIKRTEKDIHDLKKSKDQLRSTVSTQENNIEHLMERVNELEESEKSLKDSLQESEMTIHTLMDIGDGCEERAKKLLETVRAQNATLDQQAAAIDKLKGE